MLQRQGMPFFARKTIAYANITVDINQYVDSDGVMHADSKQLTMGRVASVEPRTADWTIREQQNPYFGIIAGRCRIVSAALRGAEWEELDEWLREGWGEDEDLFQSVVTSLERGWRWIQIWGFSNIQGSRHHVRKLWLEKDGVADRCRLVYDWGDSVKRE